jgi:tellurite resistance protein TehA-like permease
MATGIVSLAAAGAGMTAVALALFWVNVVVYLGLWALVLIRCFQRIDHVKADFASHARAPGFFTIIAATSVLGSQFIAIGGQPIVGQGLWFLALTLWVVLTYKILPELMEIESKPPLEKSLNGGWLLTVVATQSICVLGTRVAAFFSPESVGLVLFVALAFWLVGAMLYIWMIALIFYRCMFLPLAPGDLTPSYWINMGAMAISTLAGVSLVSQADRLPLLLDILPFIKGMTLLFWATATWWIPMLLALGFWRHIVKRFSVRYDHAYWAVVFPLGMYTVCTQKLIQELGLPFLRIIPTVSIWIALGAWLLTLVSLGRHLFPR